jgi:hypothetical protein
MALTRRHSLTNKRPSAAVATAAIVHPSSGGTGGISLLLAFKRIHKLI